MKEAATFYSEGQKLPGNRQLQQTRVSITRDGTRVQGSLTKGGEIEVEKEGEACQEDP